MHRALLLLLTACEIGPAIYVERTGEGKGEITSDPEGLHCGEDDDCAMIVDDGAITLTATPAAGSTFAGWTNAACEGPTCALRLAADTRVSARFDVAQHSVDIVRIEGGGRVTGPGIDCGDFCATTAAHGTRVELTAVADAEVMFESWGGACAGNTSPCIITVTEPVEVEAVFKPRPRVHVSVVGNGKVYGAGQVCTSECSFPSDSQTLLRPEPAPGWMFAGWQGPCVTLPMGCALQYNGGIQYVTATFAPTSTVAVEIVGSGSVTVHPGTQYCGGACAPSFPLGTHVTLIPNPDNGRTFLGWEGACTGTGTCELDANAPLISVRARFSTTVLLTVTTNTGGSIAITGAAPCASSCTMMFESATVVTLTPQPYPGFVFAGWSGACSGSGACTLTLATDTVVQAQFATDPTACTQSVTTDESAATFNARLTTPNTTICLTATITGTVDVGANNVFIRGLTPGARIAGSLRANGRTGVRLYFIAIMGEVDIYDSTVLIENSGVDSATPALYVSGPLATATVLNTVLYSSYTDYAISSFFGAHVELRNSQVHASGRAMLVGSPGAPSTARLDGNLFRKRAGTSSSESPIWSNRADGNISSSTPNTFCNEGTSTTDGAWVLPLVAGNTTPTWSFFSVAHNVQGNCP